MRLSPARASVEELGPTRPARRRVAMIARLVGIQVAAAMAVLGVPPLTPALRAEFELSRGRAGLLMTAAFLGVVAASWPAGRLVSAVGVRRSMAVACLGLGVALAATGLASSYVVVLLALFVVGIFYSPVTPATNAGVVAWASARFRTRTMAIKQMGVTGGAALSATLIPLLIAWGGWRMAAAVTGAIVALAGVVSALWFQRPAEARAASGKGRLGNRPLVVILGVAALLLLFVQHSVATHYILALQDEGVALVAAGAALGLLQLAGTAARYAWGWFADGPLDGDAPRSMLILSCASATVLVAMSAADGAAFPALSAVLLGATTQAGNGLLQVVLAESGGSAPASSTGLGMAIGFSGAVIGPPAFGFLADAWTYRSSWFVLAAIALGAGVITWRAGRASTH
jgi:ACS family hexuronate transporter-like MFS transporter